MKGLLTAFSMFSRIPLPKVSLEKENTKYALLFFPLVGVVIGAAILALQKIAVNIGASGVLFAAFAVAVPIVVTGGIHMDGFIDTFDALSSNGSIEKRNEILKDPRAGAFGVIYCCIYFILLFAFWNEVYNNNCYVNIAAIGFIASRILAGAALCIFPLSKNSGLAYTFSDGAAKKTILIFHCFYLLVISAVCLYFYTFITIAIIITMPIYIAFFYRMMMKKFGGFSGDLAGCFIQTSELIFLIAAALNGYFIG